jgi:signal peptidase II
MLKIDLKKNLLPFSLTAFIIAADQISKAIVDRSLKLEDIVRVWGDFLWIWYSRNTGMVFSIGTDLPQAVKNILLLALPTVALIILTVYYLKSKELEGAQRWCFAAILGGGLGNLIDRFFQPDGAVIDFISFKFYGILTMERFPAFNVADSSIVIAAVALILSYIISGKRSHS